VSTLRLKPCTDPYAPPAQPRVRGCPTAAVSFRAPRQPAGYISPRCSYGNGAGNRIPLLSCQGFLHAPPPFQLLAQLGPPQPPSAAQIRPLASRSGGSPVEATTTPSHSTNFIPHMCAASFVHVSWDSPPRKILSVSSLFEKHSTIGY
jgi:hypothetical protein